MRLFNWLSFCSIIAPPFSRKSLRRNRYQCLEALEPRLVLSAPNIISIDAPTQVDEGTGAAINVTFDCDDNDTTNMVRWSFDGGNNWDGPFTVTATPEGNVLGYVDTADEGARSWAVEITDSEGLVTTASGSVTVDNADPELTLDSVPTVIYDGMQAYISASTSDMGWSDALTATITWSDGTVEVQQLTSNPASFGAYHAFDLTADQTVSVTITIDDADGGSVSKSASFLYDDIMHDAEGEAHGQVGGTLSYLIGAKTDLGKISAYEIDLNNDGNADFYYMVEPDEIDPENVAIPWESGAEFFGAQPGVFGATFRAINTLGAIQAGPLSVILAAANLPDPPAPTPAVTWTPISNTNYDVGIKSEIITGQFVLQTTVNGRPHLQSAGPNSTTMTVKGNDFQTWLNSRPYFGLKFGVEQYFIIGDSTQPGVAAMPHFVQYAKTERIIWDAATQNWKTIATELMSLDGAVSDPVRPNRYAGQRIGNDRTTMIDSPGLTAGVPVKVTRLVPPNPQPNQKFEMGVEMTQTLADAKLAIVNARPGGIGTPTVAELKRRDDYYFQTYIVPPQGNQPIGYIRWSFRLEANAQTLVFSWLEAPTVIMGVDDDVWGC